MVAKRSREDAGTIDDSMAIDDEGDDVEDDLASERGSPWVADAAEEAEEEVPVECKEAPAHPPAVPSGLNAYWVRYLMRNGLAGAAMWKAHFGIGSEVKCSAEKQAELDKALVQLPAFVRHHQRQASQRRLLGSKRLLPRPLWALLQPRLAKGSSQILTATPSSPNC